MGIGIYFTYFYWYLNKDIPRVEFNTRTQTTIQLTYKWEKSNKLTLKIKVITFVLI